MSQSRPGAAPLRAAIYARFSSENQRDASIEDQVRVCRALALREGWEVAETFADYALSGSSILRPRYQALLAAMRSGQINVIVSESLDRLSRDQEHVAGLFKQAQFAGVRVVTQSEGEISELHIGLKGTMSALFLKDLAQKTHRGVEGRVRSGASGGGLSYGYQVRRGLKADGTALTGELEIVPEQAAVIRQVFEHYACGVSPRAIAKRLNSEGVAGSRSGKWTASLLLGGAGRETGLLRNRLYVGERVWNRQKWIKDPSTGRRVARLNPREAWVVTEVPELRIIAAEIWATVQRRLEASRQAVTRMIGPSEMADGTTIVLNRGGALATVRRPRWLLAGLVRCGSCSGPMTVVGSGGRLGCSNHVERGTCDNRRTVARDVVLRRVMVGLKERLLAPELVEEFVHAYVAEVNAANRERGSRRASLQGEASKFDRQIRNLLELLKEGHGGAAMAAELRELERRREALTTEMTVAATPEPVPDLHPNMPALYRRRVQMLEEGLADPTTAAAAAEALRSLVDAILVIPGERRGEVTLSLRGDLAAFLHVTALPEGSEGAKGRNAKTPAIQWDSGRFGEVLGSWDAGTGFEPVTFRL